jgi:hypothetical protein
MRYLVVSLGVILLAASVLTAPSLADSVSYTVTGTFGSGTGSAPLAGPDGTYSLSFSLPQNPTPDFFDTTAGDFAVFAVPITYSFLCNTCSTAATFGGLADNVDFASASLGGLFSVEFLTGGHDYFFDFLGAQLFSGSVDHPTLLSINGDLPGSGIFGLDNNAFVDLGSPTVTVTTPEPSTLALLFAALASLGLVAWIKSQRA